MARTRRASRLAVLGAVTALVAACGSAASPSPSTPPAGSPTSGSPTPSAAAATPSPTSSTPQPATGRWIAAGEVSREFPVPTLVPLASGGALLMGPVLGPEDETVTAADLFDPAANAWHPTTAMEHPRSKFAAIGLRDGRALVAGGYNENDASYSSAYLFDPGAGTWTKTGPMTVARTNPSIALLPDGRVLVAGGYFYAPEEAIRGQDIVLAAWHAPGTGSGAGRGPLNDVDIPPQGRALATAEVFDPSTGEWSATGSMRYARSGSAAVTLADGRVLIVGSADDNVHIDAAAFITAELYDPATGRFSRMGSLPDFDAAAIKALGVELPAEPGLPGAVGSLAALPDGGAVLIGHQEWWKHEAELVRSFRFQPAGTWTEIGQPYANAEGEQELRSTGTVSRLGAVVATLPDSTVFVADASPDSDWTLGNPLPPLKVERYDPTADAWTSLPDLPEGRLDPNGTRLSDGSVLLMGGYVPVGTGEDASTEWARTTWRFIPGS